jgi:hypothetical protein
MQAPLVLPLRLSPFLQAALLLMHWLPVCAVWIAPIESWQATGVTLLVCASAGWHIRGAWASWQSRIVLNASGKAQLVRHTDSGDASEDIRILPGSVDLGWLVVLNWRHEETEKTERFALSRESCSVADWRDLRRWLRWQISTEA